MRAFIAIKIPEEIRERICAIGAAAPGEMTRVRKENIHITLQFLGEVDDDVARKVIEAVKGVECRPFRVSIMGLSYFGGGEVHTIFAKVIDEGRISLLYKDIQDKLSGEGIRVDADRGYIPHATISRVKHWDHELKAFITKNSDTDFGEFEVNAVSVEKSALSEKGPAYSTLYEHKLQHGN